MEQLLLSQDKRLSGLIVLVDSQVTIMEDYLRQLRSIPWFSNLGKPTSQPLLHKAIHCWEEWLGPEDNAVCEMHLRQQALYDSILEGANYRRNSLEELWRTIHDIVFGVAATAVPFDPGKDAWHAPNSAVWHAAWTAGLVGFCLALNRSIPEELQMQWTCFASGHWPCGWEGEFPKGKLIIF
jgi:hypothetical protein